jgi:hypothetical protein
MTDEHISLSSPFPTVLSIDGRERVRDFLDRHGGPARDVEHEGDRDEKTSGWSNVHAADGYRLRCEWSALGSERRMSFVEIAPGTAPGADRGGRADPAAAIGGDDRPNAR